MKKNWKAITATALCFVIVLGTIYYTNCVYIPQMKAQQAADAETSAGSDSGDRSDYNYTISNSSPVSSSAGSAGSSDSVQETKEENGDVTINRTWDAKEGELDTSSSSPNSTVDANIGSSGAKITGSDGTYQGETPAKASSSTTKSTTPSTSKSSSSSGTSAKSSGSSKTTSSTPKDGDRRTVDGKEQEYWVGFGWVDVGSGGSYEPSAGQNSELSGIQVGEMG